MDKRERRDLEDAAAARREAVIADRADRLRHFLVAEYGYDNEGRGGNLQAAMLSLMVDAEHLASLDTRADEINLKLAGWQAPLLAQEERHRVPFPEAESASD